MTTTNAGLHRVIDAHAASTCGRAAAAALTYGLANGMTVAQIRAALRHCGRDDLASFAQNPGRLAPVTARVRAHLAVDVRSRRRAAARRMVGHVLTPQPQGTRHGASLSPAKALKARYTIAYVGSRLLTPGHEWDSVILTAGELGHLHGGGANARIKGGRQLDAAVELGGLTIRQRRKGGGTVVALPRLTTAQGSTAIDAWESIEALAIEDPREYPVEVTHPHPLVVLLTSPARHALWSWAPDGYWGHGTTGLEAWGVLVAVAAGQLPKDLGVNRRHVAPLVARLLDLGLLASDPTPLFARIDRESRAAGERVSLPDLGALALPDPMELLATIETLAETTGATDAAGAAKAAVKVERAERLASLKVVREVKAAERAAETRRTRSLAARKRAAMKATVRTDTIDVLTAPTGFDATSPAHVESAVRATNVNREGRWEYAGEGGGLVRCIRVDDLDHPTLLVPLPDGFRRGKHGEALRSKVAAARGGVWTLGPIEDGRIRMTQVAP